MTAIVCEMKGGRLVETECKIVLTRADVKAIKIAEAEMERGEGIDFREFAKRMRKKYGIKASSKTKDGKR